MVKDDVLAILYDTATYFNKVEQKAIEEMKSLEDSKDNDKEKVKLAHIVAQTVGARQAINKILKEVIEKVAVEGNV